ncbi:WD repeat, SAM and U-box domain-containing protein 1-like [Chironomus tepperi]|uniref:WD repeat, SAM and U-box domain-containing protein 1-like n=1 Tax=Chironomus tepperi TaxID=113505 RepID=UPI00391F2781
MSVAPKLLQRIDAHHSDVTSIDFFGNSLLVTGSSDKTVRLFKWISGSGFEEDKSSPFLGHKYAVTKVEFSPKGYVVASSSVDGTVIFWDANTGERVDIIHQPNGEAIRNMQFCPDGSLIATTDDTGVICIFGQEKKLMKSIKGIHEESVPTLTFSKDSKIMLTGCTLGNVRLFFTDFDAEQIEPDLLIDNGHDMGILDADFCKTTRFDPLHLSTKIYTLATSGNDNLIKIWRIYTIIEDTRPSRRNSTTSDSPKLYSRLVPTTMHQHFSGTATIYPTTYMNAECVNSFTAHGSSVTSVKFNATGTLLVSGSLDRLIKIWDMQGNCLKTLDEHARYVNCVAINADSTILASGSNDKQVHIWDLTGSFTLDSHISNGLRSLLMTLQLSDQDVPMDFVCPITSEIMTDPVILEDGFSYERQAILTWFSKDKRTSPMTNMELTTTEVMTNEKLKMEIESFLKKLDMDPFE